MTVRNRAGIAIFVSFVVAGVQLARAQGQQAPVPAQSVQLDQAVPRDPRITIGYLPNGLRYYIRTNGRPVQRAELRLAIDIGSAAEDDDQRGVAHFIEHMAFNGSR